MSQTYSRIDEYLRLAWTLHKDNSRNCRLQVYRSSYVSRRRLHPFWNFSMDYNFAKSQHCDPADTEQIGSLADRETVNTLSPVSIVPVSEDFAALPPRLKSSALKILLSLKRGFRDDRIYVCSRALFACTVKDRKKPGIQKSELDEKEERDPSKVSHIYGEKGL